MMACGGVWSSLEEGRPGGVQKEIPIRSHRANGVKTLIVSGGGIEFMRPWTEAVYVIPAERAWIVVDMKRDWATVFPAK